MPALRDVERFLPWILRLLWVGVLVAGGSAIDAATASNGGPIDVIARYGGLSLWLGGVIAMAIPAVVSLTAVRLLIPLAVPAATTALVAGAGVTTGVAFLTLATLATVVAYSADIGRIFVQASAYGEEDRHVLRPPAAYALASVITWLIWATSLIAAPLLIGDGRWLPGAIAATAAIGGGILGWPRWHRLSTRWFVVVPVGIVIHDRLVLAETVMLRRHEVAEIRLAPAETQAADLTGPAAGHAVEIVTTEPTTVIYAATPKRPMGTAIHLSACLIAPSRPGRALKAASARRLPVG